MEEQDIFNRCISHIKEGNCTQQVDLIIDMLKRTPFFHNYFGQCQYENSLKNLAQMLKYQEVAQGNFIINKGQSSEFIYIILEGKLGGYTPKKSIQIQEQEQSINQIQRLSQNLSQQEDQSSPLSQKLIGWIKKYKKQLELNENEEENKLIEKDVKSSKIFFKEYKGYRINTFKKDKEFSRGDVFGEVDWQYRLKYPSSILSLTHCKFACIQNDFFLQNFQSQKKIDIVKCIKNQLWNVNLENFGFLSSYFNEQQYCRGQDIFKEGEQCSSIYIVKKGTLQLSKQYNQMNGSIEKNNQNQDEFKIKYLQQPRKIIIQNIEEGYLFGHEDIKDKIRSFTITSLSSDTVLYEISLQQFYRLADIQIYTQIISDGVLKKQWLQNKFQDINQKQFTNISSPKRGSVSPQRLNINKEIESPINLMMKQSDSNQIETNIKNSLTNGILNGQNIKKRQNSLIQLNPTEQQSKLQLNDDALTFQQTKTWVKQQKNKKEIPKRVNRSQQFISMKELASDPIIQNYCNQQAISPSQSNIQIPKNIISLTQLEDSQSPTNRQKSFIQQQNFKQLSAYRKKSVNSNLEQIPDSKNSENSLYIGGNISPATHNRQQNSNYKNNSEVSNIHVQRLKQQNLQKFNQILKGSVVQKTKLDQQQNTFQNVQKQRPQSSINTVKSFCALSPVQRQLINNNNQSFKNEPHLIQNCKPATPISNTRHPSQECLITLSSINGNTPQSKSNQIQIRNVQSTKNSRYKIQSSLNQSLSFVQQVDYVAQSQKLQQESQPESNNKQKEFSPLNSIHQFQQILFSTPSNQNTISQSNLQNSTKLLFYRTQQKTAQQSSQQHQQILQNTTIKKKLLDIHSVQETEEDTNQIKQNILGDNELSNNNQPIRPNIKSLQNLILKIGSSVQETSDRKVDLYNQNQQMIEIQEKQGNNKSIGQVLKTMKLPEENMTQFSTALQSNFISQKQSFHNSNSSSQINQIINTSPLYQNNQGMRHKKQFSLQLRQSFSPKKISSSQLSQDLSNIFDKRQPPYNQISEYNAEYSPIYKSKYMKQQMDTASDRFKNDSENFSTNQTFLNQINSQSNRRNAQEDLITKQNIYSNRKQGLDKQEVSYLNSREDSAENTKQFKNSSNKINLFSDIQEQQQQQKSNNQKIIFQRKHENQFLKNSQSSNNLDLNIVKVKQYNKQNTLDQSNLANNSSKRKFGSLADIKFESGTFTEKSNKETQQQYFEEIKKELLKNISDQQSQNQNNVKENGDQKKDRTQNQRKSLNKTYIDFLKYYKNTLKTNK